MRTDCIGWHVMLKGMHYWKTCGSDGMSFMRMCYGRTCLVGGYVLQVCAEAATI